MGKVYDRYSREYAQQLLKELKKGYINYYINYPDKQIFFQKKISTQDHQFWQEVVDETKKHVSEKFNYSDSSVHKFFYAKITETFPRNFKIQNIEYLKELTFHYGNNDSLPPLQKTTEIKTSKVSIVEEIDTKSSIVASNEIDNYKVKIKNDFKEIKVGYDGVPISIEHIVELPFFRIDKIEKERLNLLKNELKLLEQQGTQSKRSDIQRIKDEINRINIFFDQKNKPLEILKKQNDIFLSSPAGTGKTTALKWIAYKLTQKNNSLIPIFIELQSYVSNLDELIEFSLKSFGLSFQTIAKKRLVLLIDGFDEYANKDESKLIREIRSFKKIYNCQIIFSGRYKPVGLGEKEFETYKLSSFKPKDIHRVLTHIFPEKGFEYFEKLRNSKLLKSINIPLYLMFLITHLKKQEGFNLHEVNILLKNKGKLLKKVLIEDFLNKYENTEKIKIPEHKWFELKNRQIQLISRLSYHLTLELGDKENIEKEKAIEYFKKQIEFENIDFNQLLIDFNRHSILSFKRDNVGFDVKEIRLFFVAYYLADKIKAPDDYWKQKKLFKGEKDSWKSIEKYLFGLIKPSNIMKPLDSFTVNGQILCTNRLIRQLEYALKFISSGNIKEEFKLLNKFYLLNIVAFLLFNDVKFEMNNKKNTTLFHMIIFFFIRRIKYGRKYFVSLIPRMNNEFFYIFPFIPPKHEVSMINPHTMGSILGKGLYADMFRSIKINKHEFKKTSFQFNKTPIVLENLNRTPDFLFSIVNNLIFDPHLRDKKTRLRILTNNEHHLEYIKTFLKDFIRLYINEYLNFYFKTHSPSTYNLKTLYNFLIRNELSLDSDKLFPKNRKKIISYINIIGLNNKNRYGLKIIVHKTLRKILYFETVNEILDEWHEKLINTTNKQTRANLSYNFNINLRDKDIPLFIDLLQSDEDIVKQNSIYGLSFYISKSYDKEKDTVVNAFLAIHETFLKSSEEIKLHVLNAFGNYGVQPPEYFLDVIFKFVSSFNNLHKVIIDFFGNSNIKKAIPYLVNLMDKKNMASLWAYDALFKIDSENFYKYDYIFFKKKREEVQAYLSKVIEQGFFNLSKNNNDFLEICVNIGGQKILDLLKKVKNKSHQGKLKLSIDLHVKINHVINSLEKRMQLLRLTNQYQLDYQQQKPSD